MLKDVTRVIEWKTGVESVSLSSKNGVTKARKDAHSGHDMINIKLDDQTRYVNRSSNREHLIRYWNRENNGCSWLLECEKNGYANTFYLLQPLEDLENSCLTVLTYLPWCSTFDQCAEYTSCVLGSLQDYFSHRKLKAVPLTDINMPHESLKNNIVFNEQDQDSSPSEEETFKSEKTFLQLKPKEQLEILEKSESILKMGLSPRKRVQVRRRSSSDPRSIMKTAEDGEARPRSQTDDAVMNPSTQNDFSQENNEINTQVKVEKHTPKGDNVPLEEVEYKLEDYSDSGSDISAEYDTEKIDSLEVTKPPNYTQPSSEPDTVKYITSANHVAAELLGIALRVSEMDLRKSPKQQSESTSGWIFYGLENDVVVMNRIFPTSCKIMSYLGKGLIHASPQTVFEAIKNPRTRFMYDETLKRVEILNTITEKIKTVYYYHEILQMFKKGCFDFNILQNERQDGEKYILAMQSIDNGLPIPVGVDRVLMLPSGWIIEPVTRDNKLYSMVTYVMQMDFSQSRFSFESPQLKELISRQPLSIMYLRQYLHPAMMMSRQALSKS